jgi:predicted DNA-binding transcriptional regulator YafY
VAEYYATSDVDDRDDGALEVTLPSRHLAWVARLLLRLGPDAEVIDPPELADERRELARQTLSRYGR